MVRTWARAWCLSEMGVYESYTESFTSSYQSPHVGFLEKGVSLRLFHPFCPDSFQSITHNRVPRNQPTLKVEPGNFPGEDAGLPVATISPKRVGESTGNQLGARAGGNLGDKVMS